VRLSPPADDPNQAAVASVGGGAGAQRQDLVAAPAQGTQVSGQAGSASAQVELLFHIHPESRVLFGKLLTKDSTRLLVCHPFSCSGVYAFRPYHEVRVPYLFKDFYTKGYKETLKRFKAV
jgi:hypothetical protein